MMVRASAVLRHCDAGIRRICLRKALILHMSEARILFAILGFGSFVEEK